MKLDPLAAAVASRAKELALLRPGDRVLVAVSGGADSLALLHVLWSLRTDLGLEALAVASLDHGLRGEAGAADVAFVGEIAARLGLSFHAGKLEPESLSDQGDRSPEEAARQARYAFLGGIARRWGPGPAGPVRVATGHTADDQAETVLMRIVEGTGLRGLAGMPAERPDDGWTLVRPLLGAGRADTLDYCRRWGLAPREDATNADPRYRRNLVRRRLLPLLREMNPRVVEAVTRLADQARAAAEPAGGAPVIRGLAALLERGPAPAGESPFAGLGTGERGPVHFPKAILIVLGDSLGPDLVRSAAAALAGEEVLRDLGYEGAVRAARAAATLQVGGRLDLPGGLVLEAGYRHIFLAARAGVGPGVGGSGSPDGLGAPDFGAFGPVTLASGGPTEVRELGWVFRVEMVDGRQTPGLQTPGPEGPARPRPAPGALAIDLDPAELDLPLAVRTRRRGDAFHPAGLGPPGQGVPKKLKDLFISAKVPRAQRGRWPLVVDARDRIAWVVGLRADERFLARAESRRALRIMAERA